MKSFILIAACLLQTAFGAPQLISFKDGKVGVNFLGYHAEAGLGGGQNDGGLLGGLHASAGTPWGQNAAAGLGGNVNGRAAGMLYAGAQATPDVGASAVLGGDTSRGGFSGTDAYANGKVASRTHTISSAGNTRYRQEQQQQQHQQQHQHQPQPQADNNEAVLPPQPIAENSNAIQKIRPPKKFYSSERHHPVRRQFIAPQASAQTEYAASSPCEASKPGCANAHVNRPVRSEVVQSALQIPIGILQSLQSSLGNLGVAKGH